MLNLIATLMKAGEALEGFAPAVQRDLLTGLSNRIGLEVLLASGSAATQDGHAR